MKNFFICGWFLYFLFCMPFLSHSQIKSHRWNLGDFAGLGTGKNISMPMGNYGRFSELSFLLGVRIRYHFSLHYAVGIRGGIQMNYDLGRETISDKMVVDDLGELRFDEAKLKTRISDISLNIYRFFHMKDSYYSLFLAGGMGIYQTIANIQTSGLSPSRKPESFDLGMNFGFGLEGFRTDRDSFEIGIRLRLTLGVFSNKEPFGEGKSRIHNIVTLAVGYNRYF